MQRHIQDALYRLVGEARSRFQTNIPHQDSVYRAKLSQAIEFKAAVDPNIDDAKYAYIKTDNTFFEDEDAGTTCDRIINAHNNTVAKLAQIEAIRLDYTDQLEQDPAGIVTVFGNLITALNNVV
jgi:hypothetical protein